MAPALEVQGSEPRRARGARWLAIPAVAIVLTAGVWVAGGLITDDYRTSMALTAVWFVAAAVAAGVIGLRHRGLLVPLLAGYLVTAAAVGGFLAWSTLHDRVVDEDIVVGVPSSQLPSREAGGAGTEKDAKPVRVASGEFQSLEHESSGEAAIVRLPSGRRVLTFKDFSTSAGPDLRVRLVVGDTSDGGSAGAIDLGALKGNRGNQQYKVPDSVNLRRYTTVVVWCRAFSAGFAKAPLARD